MKKARPVIDDGTRKRCSQCGEEKPFNAFGSNGVSKKGEPLLTSRCRACGNIRGRAYAGEGSARIRTRERHLLRAYNLTLDGYQTLLDRQNGACAACGRPERILQFGRPLSLAVDHDHETNKVRALLCSNCNRALGLLEDDPVLIEALLRYRSQRDTKAA